MKYAAAVIDTNVVVAGLLTKDIYSPTARILDGICAGEFPFLLSTTLLAEYRQVLLRRRIRALHGSSEREVDALLMTLAANAIVREPQHRSGSPDPDDAHVWALVQSGASCGLVSGDHALLNSRAPRSPACTPRQFVELLAKQPRT